MLHVATKVHGIARNDLYEVFVLTDPVELHLRYRGQIPIMLAEIR
jgi:hypothetical protein